MHACPYLSPVLTDLKRVVRRLLPFVRKVAPDSLVVTGVSGLLVGPAIVTARRSKRSLNLVIVRKSWDGSHSRYKEEYVRPLGRWLFVDDLIESGATVRLVDQRLAGQGTPAGGLFYQEGGKIRLMKWADCLTTDFRK